MGILLRYLFLLLVLMWPMRVEAQPFPYPDEVPLSLTQLRALSHPEMGRPFYLEHYQPSEYGGYPQNWSVVQDPDGVVYVANGDRILEYDGSSWRSIRIGSGTIARSLARGLQGTIYVGLVGDFGYLAPDSIGRSGYVSLLEHVPQEERDFKDIWSTQVSSEGVFFQSADRIFRWDGEAMQSWPSEAEQRFHTSFVVNDRFFVRQVGVGLLELDADSLYVMPDGARFEETRVYTMAPYGETHLLVATRDEGLFLYDGVAFKRFFTEVDEWLRTYRLYHGIQLSEELYALAALDGGGVAIIDKRGRLIQNMNEPKGILDDWINYIYADAQGGLWAALNSRGIIRMDVISPLTVYDGKDCNRRHGLQGVINDVQRFQGRLYVATLSGLYVLDKEAPCTFTQIEGVSTSWSLHPADSVLFVGASEGLLLLRGTGGVEPVLGEKEISTVFKVYESPRHRGELFLGTKEGLTLVRHTRGDWDAQTSFGDFEGVKKEVRDLIVDDDDVLWASTFGGYVYRFALPDGENLPTRQSTLLDGLQELDVLGGQPTFGTSHGIYRYQGSALLNHPSGDFFLDPALLSSAEVGADSLYTYQVDPMGRAWLAYSDHIEIATSRGDGTFTFETPGPLRFSIYRGARIFVEADGVAWIGNGEQLIRYDSKISKRYDSRYGTLVRSVVSPITGEVFYGGARPFREAHLHINFADNDLSFQVAALSFNDVEANEYQFYLEGVDEGWTDWTTANSKNYRDLWEGQYLFHARARNAQGILGKEATFAFQVLPPWYRTWWAYSVYLFGLLCLAALSRHYYNILQENEQAREQAKELERERIARERLKQANDRLQQANDSLTQVNKLKDEFLANTSHELRTPLTAILGFSAILKEELPEAFLELLDPIESNGQRLLRTVNSLLDIARLRSGMMEVLRTPVEVGEQVAEIVRSLAPLAQQKDLLLELIRPATPVYGLLDARYLERILDNLIGNAIKFTDAGKVSIAVSREGDLVEVSVSDTGIGIDPSFLPHLFDEFKQESTGLSRSYEGSGLGLAITARLVRLMDGVIEVQSEKGGGSVFTIRLPASVSQGASSSGDALPDGGVKPETTVPSPAFKYPAV